MNVVVIGGAGFIGSHLVDRLLAEGHAVDVIDDLSSGSLANLAEARASGGLLKIHHLDARSDEAATLIGMRRPDVIHDLSLFDRVDRSARRQGRGFESALATLEAARRHGVGKVIAAVPATSLYGQPAPSSLPVKEGELRPRGVRGVVARAVIDLLASYREQYAVEFAALALATVYGPRQHSSGGVIAELLSAHDAGHPARLDGGGRQTRDFLFVDDAVDAFVRAAERGSGLVVNVGTGVQTTIRDVWELIAPGAPAESAPPRSDDLPRFAISPARARIHLGWSPWTDVADGLTRLR
ncbi:MAG: NAD-dependent epimerase/dehydratase family protein [Actinomycetota bacterium]